MHIYTHSQSYAVFFEFFFFNTSWVILYGLLYNLQLLQLVLSVYLQSNVCLPMSVYMGLLHYFISSIIFHCVDVASLNQIPLMDIYIFLIFFIITKNVAMDPLSCTS